VFLITRNQT